MRKYLLFSLLAIVFAGNCFAQNEPIAFDNQNNIDPLTMDFNSESIIKEIANVNKGKVVYVDVWNTWCGPCFAQFPYSVKLHEKYKDKVVFMYICLAQDVTKWRELIYQNRLIGQHVLSTNSLFKKLEKELGKLSVAPHYFLIGKDGELITPNAPRPSSYEIEKTLDKAIKE